MSTAVSSLASTSTTATSSTQAGSSGSGIAGMTDAAGAQDRFLKLLVAQLNNQDPMNPIDNAQMTSQMAQISTVSGIEQLNTTLKSVSDQFTSVQYMQSAALVGRTVLSAGDQLVIDGGTASGAFDLAGQASSVKVQVLSPGGQVLDTIDMGALEGGRHDFSWDASSYSAGGTPKFKVVADNSGQKVTATPYMRDRVDSVGMESGAVRVQLRSGASVAPSSIASVL